MRKPFLAILALLLASACSSYDPPAATRLTSPVTSETVAQVKAAIARGEKTIDVGDAPRPFEFNSGGDARAAREAAALMKANGVGARVVGFAGSALAEIALGSASCTVTPNGNIKVHLAFVPDGTPEQNALAEAGSIVWWSAQATGSPGKEALVRNVAASPTKAWLLRTDELQAVGCRL